MSWNPSWDDLDEADREVEMNKDNTLLDAEGYRIRRGCCERLQRALAMLIFIFVFPVIVISLGLYRLITSLGSLLSKRREHRD